MRQPAKQIAYKYCINFANWISVPNIVHQLTLSLRCNHWKIQNSGDFQDAIYYTPLGQWRRAGNGSKPMTSVFYDVIRPEALCGGSNVPTEGQFWRFLGNLNPKMLWAIMWTPKRHFLTSQRVLWAIVRQNPSTGHFGHFSRRVRGKCRNKKRGLIFHVFRQALPYSRLAQILGYVFVSWK